MSGPLKRFLKVNFGEVEEKRFKLFDPPQAESLGIAWNPESGISAWLRQALDLLKNVSEQAKKDMSNSPLNINYSDLTVNN